MQQGIVVDLRRSAACVMDVVSFHSHQVGRSVKVDGPVVMTVAGQHDQRQRLGTHTRRKWHSNS